LPELFVTLAQPLIRRNTRESSASRLLSSSSLSINATSSASSSDMNVVAQALLFQFRQRRPPCG
jgi:hypothetical protein